MVVVASDTPSEYGFFGELLATALAARGVRGLVIDAGCRDIAELTAMGFPVWSKCVSAQGTVKERLGSVNVPVTCAGASVEPGDVVVGDDDGVVIVPRAEAASVLAAAKLREEKEARSRERYQRGELSLDVNGMRADLANLGSALRRLRGRRPVIIDIHGHYTTAPQALQDFRDAQLACARRPGAAGAARCADQRRRDPGERRAQPAADPAGARRRPDAVVAEGVRDGTPRPRPIDRDGMGQGVERSGAPGRAAVSGGTSLRWRSCRRHRVASSVR